MHVPIDAGPLYRRSLCSVRTFQSPGRVMTIAATPGHRVLTPPSACTTPRTRGTLRHRCDSGRPCSRASRIPPRTHRTLLHMPDRVRQRAVHPDSSPARPLCTRPRSPGQTGCTIASCRCLSRRDTRRSTSRMPPDTPRTLRCTHDIAHCCREDTSQVRCQPLVFSVNCVHSLNQTDIRSSAATPAFGRCALCVPIQRRHQILLIRPVDRWPVARANWSACDGRSSARWRPCHAVRGWPCRAPHYQSCVRSFLP